MRSTKSANQQETLYCHDWLYELFHTIYKNEIGLECIRVALHSRSKDFPALLSKLDPDKNHFITSKSLWKFMREQKLPATFEHAYCILKTYHIEKDEKLTEENLRAMLIPTVLRSGNDYANNFEFYDIVLLFSMLLAKEIAFIDVLSVLIRSLSKHGITVYDAYSLVLSNVIRGNENAVTSFNLMEYFGKVHGVEITADFADLIIRRLDRDKDNKISYLDFINSLYFHNVQEIEQRTARIIKKDLARTPTRKRIISDESSGKKSTHKKIGAGRRSVNQTSNVKPLFNSMLESHKKLDKPKNIVELLKEFIHRSRELEKERQELAERIDFTLKKAWHIFSPENNHKVKMSDFYDNCIQLGIKESAIKPFLKSNLQYIEGEITKSEFEEKVLPSRKAHKKLLRMREKTDQEVVPLSTKLCMHTKKLLAWVLELAFEHIKDANYLKEQIEEQGDITKEKVMLLLCA